MLLTFLNAKAHDFRVFIVTLGCYGADCEYEPVPDSLKWDNHDTWMSYALNWNSRICWYSIDHSMFLVNHSMFLFNLVKLIGFVQLDSSWVKAGIRSGGHIVHYFVLLNSAGVSFHVLSFWADCRTWDMNFPVSCTVIRAFQLLLVRVLLQYHSTSFCPCQEQEKSRLQCLNYVFILRTKK